MAIPVPSAVTSTESSDPLTVTVAAAPVPPPPVISSAGLDPAS